MDGPDDTVWVDERHDMSGATVQILGTGLIIVAALLLITCLFSLVTMASHASTIESILASEGTLVGRGVAALFLGAAGTWLARNRGDASEDDDRARYWDEGRTNRFNRP